MLEEEEEEKWMAVENQREAQIILPSPLPKQTLAWGREDLVPHQVKIRIIPEDGCSSFWIKNGFVT